MLVRSLHRSSNAIFASQRRTWTSLSRHVNGLTIHALDNTNFPYNWLRDSCQSPESVHPSTKQKLHRTSDIPFDIVPEDGESGVRVTADGLEINWNDGHKSVFEKHWLEENHVGFFLNKPPYPCHLFLNHNFLKHPFCSI